MKWAFLMAAIAAEVIGTTLMKLSNGGTKSFYAVGVVVFYGLSLTLLTFALKFFDVSVAYAIWSGVGIAAISIIGMAYFHEPATSLKVVSLVLVLVGVVGLHIARLA